VHFTRAGSRRLDQNQTSCPDGSDLIHLNARFVPGWHGYLKSKEVSVTVSTMLVIIIGVLAFAAFAATLAWAQLSVRPAGTVPAKIVRPKRRPF
jgi:hypothetical protein